jgi:hypothetical protein
MPKGKKKQAPISAVSARATLAAGGAGGGDAGGGVAQRAVLIPRKNPIIIIFEQHSFSSGSEIAAELIRENWCGKLGFELPRDMGLDSIKQDYQAKRISAGFADEGAAITAFNAAISVFIERGARQILSVCSQSGTISLQGLALNFLL